MSLIRSGSSRAICSVGSSLISSSDARSISRTSHALASSSRERSRRARGPRIGVMRLRSLCGPGVAGGCNDPTPGFGVALTRSPAMPDLISIAEARARVLDAVWPLPSETASLRHALGRVLAQDVASEVSVPPFDSSAMDGYAVFGDRDGELELIGEARAGRPAEVELRPGTAIAVSTGAAVPRGTFAVVPVERTRRAGEGRVVVESPVPGANVRRSGEDVVAGDVVLRAGASL